jgi:hypothetical protein
MTRVALAVLVVVLGGCALRDDASLRFRSPPDGARVTGAVRLTWTAGDVPPGGRYAIFVDRAPMRPGRDLDSLADSNALCRRLPGCPDADWLADNHVWVSERPELVLPALPASVGRRAPGGLRRHELTLVVLDGTGRRVTEAARRLVLYDRDRREGR